MNQKEWKKSGKFPGKYEWYNKTRKLQRSLQFNTDKDAKVIHHLRDTEEQRKYNDEHYELWGFNQDGTFEYGKYVIFLTKEEHTEIHKCSEETRKKIGDANRGENNGNFGKHLSDEAKNIISAANKGDKNGMHGKTHSDEVKAIISKTSKERWEDESYRQYMSNIFKSREFSEEHRRKLSESKLGDKNPMFGTHHTDEEKEHLSQIGKAYWTDERKREQSEQRNGHFVSDETKTKIGNALRGKTHTNEQKAHLLSVSEKWKEYKSNGGTMTWNEFQKANRLYDK